MINNNILKLKSYKHVFDYVYLFRVKYKKQNSND